MSRSRDFDDFAASFYTHMKNADDEKANIILRLGSDRFAASERTADQLYASLCIQFLEQAPSLILWIRHLYPNTRDAVLGLEGLWKARALERLLRTLFLVPKRQITYCLFHCPKASPRNTLIGRILNVMEVSEIQLRLLVLVPDAEIGIQIVDNSPLVDLSSDSAIAGGHRPEPPWRWCKGVVNSRLTELWATIVAPRDYQIRSSALTIDKEPLQFSDSHNLLILAEQTLTRCFDNGITWVLRAVAWISFAVRPLSRLEAEQVLEVLCGNETSIPTDMKLGAELLNLLELILPGLLFIEHQALWVPPQLKLKLASIWDARSHENPDSFIAASCFNLAMNFFKKQLDVKAEPEACTQKHEDLDAAGTATPRAENDRAHEAIANYAVRYWIEHQRRGTQYPEKAEEVFRRLLESNPSLDLATWSRHIASCSWSCNIKDDKRQQIQPETLQSDFQLTPFAACYVSFRIASLPLTHDDNFEWLLLGTAIEHMSNDAILRKIDAVPTSKPNNLSSIMLQRLLATAGHSLRNQLISKFKDDDSFRHNFVGVLLTSIAVGNAQAVTEYLDMASRYALGQKYEEGKAWRLGTALQVACEYCDSGVATKILNLEDLSPLQLEKLYPWNAIHVACHQGDATMLNMLSEHDHSQYQALGQRTLPQYNPITIAATRGLYSILRNQLRAFRFISQDVDQQNAYGASPLYSVYQYGFLETLEELLGFVGLRFSTKRHNSEAMLLALKSGSDTLAIRAYSDYLGAIIDAICEAQNHHGQQSEDGADSPKENAEEQRVVEEAEKVIGEALFTAIQSGSQSSFRSIIRNLNEPAKIRDSMGRTPLMVSSIVGVVEFCDDLYTTDEDLKDDYKRTAMHCACQYGSLEIVEFLLRKGNQSSSVGPGEQPAAPLDLTQQDDLPATPLIRAALAGHKSIVNLLLPRLDCKALREEFFLAAKSGLEWILGPILGAVVEIDPTERTKCVNGVGEGGFTPLHDAAMSNHVRVVEFLLLHGADIEATNDSGNTPLALASDTSSLHSMKLLLHAGADTEAPIRRQRTVLTQAIFYEVESSVQLLLDNGALPRLCSNWSYYESLLDFTVKQSSDRVLKVLLTHFEKCNKRVSPGRLPKGIPTPEDCLRTIIEKGSFDSFNAFLEVWGDIDPILSRWMYEKKYEYEIGRRFKYAAAYGSFEVMERIYDRDCSNGQVDVNEWGGHYGTALEAAIAQSEDSMPKVKALIGWGAKLMPEDEEDGEKSSLASWKDKWLHSRWGTALHAAVWSADGGVIEFIIKQKPELKDQRDLMGRLPLHLAALYADYDMAQKLTSDQFPIAAGDYQQRNILHLACGVGDRSFVGSLFLSEESKFNALINEPDIQGWTPLHWAARSRNADLVEFLVQKGAKKGKRTISPEGWLPYHVAIYHNRVNLLVQLAVDSLDGGDVNGGDKPTEAGEYIGGTCDCCVCVSPHSPGTSLAGDRSLGGLANIFDAPRSLCTVRASRVLAPSRCVRRLIFASSALNIV